MSHLFYIDRPCSNGKTDIRQTACNHIQSVGYLDEKGMTIADMAFARHALETIGYYRFTGYAYTFRDQADNSSYLEGTTFGQVMNLYEFDRELKQILFGISNVLKSLSVLKLLM